MYGFWQYRERNTAPAMKPKSASELIKELKRRRVFRGIIVYGASTLILLEAAGNICNVFGIETIPKWFVLLLGIGFLGSLWFSWIYDITPGGIIKTESFKDEKVQIPQKKLKTYRATTFLSMVIIIGLLIWAIRTWKTAQVEEPEYRVRAAE